MWRSMCLPVSLSILVSCASDGVISLVRTTPEEAGENCPYGGMRIDIGLDFDRDNRLDPRETRSTEYLCNQRVDGRSVAVRTRELDTSDPRCPQGGVEISSGIDENDNRMLDEGEIENSTVVCEGRDGVDGEDGFDSLVRLVDIAPDLANIACPLGGTRIETGRDENRNGILDDSEVESFQSVCAIRVHEDLMLVDQAVELPGSNCPHGGTRVRFGLDDDGDRILDAEEVEGAPLFMCNEQTLIAGKSALVTTENASLAQCTLGGFVMRFGLDDDYDGILDGPEIDGFEVVCNGRDGHAGLVEQTPTTGGVCGSGVAGILIESGLDVDDDGRLDSDEITASETVCDGLEGPPGLPGPAALVVQTDDVRFCGEGVVILTGTDWDLDGSLDYDEIESETEICSGLDGANAMVEVYDGSSDCYPDEGVVLRTGTDWDGDGYLDSDEYVESVLCGI